MKANFGLLFEWPLKTGFTVYFKQFLVRQHSNYTTVLRQTKSTAPQKKGRRKTRQVRKRAKIRNQYNQAPHLTQDTKGKVTRHHKREPRGQPFPSRQQTDVHESITKQDRNNINDPQKKYRLGMVSKIFYCRA